MGVSEWLSSMTRNHDRLAQADPNPAAHNLFCRNIYFTLKIKLFHDFLNVGLAIVVIRYDFNFKLLTILLFVLFKMVIGIGMITNLECTYFCRKIYFTLKIK